LVPKTSIDKNDFTVPHKDDVGLSRKFGVVEPIAESHFVDKSPDLKLWARVGIPDFPHEVGSFFG